MTHFYSIHVFRDEDVDFEGEYGYFTLYSTFDKACDAMDKMILDYIARLDKAVISDLVFDKPDREPLRKEMETKDWVRYCYLNDRKFTICKSTVVE
jgi:hypothetical protein